MLFSSYTFLFCFLPLFLAVWQLAGHIFPGRQNIHALVLLFFSLLFYSVQGLPQLFLLIFMAAMNYALGTALTTPMADGDGGVKCQRRKIIFLCAIILNLLPLIWFKYSSFLASNIALVFDASWRFDPPALPLGISFYTFIQIAWLAGVYKGTAKPTGFWRHALFTSCFPYVISGPIVRPDQVSWQFDRLDPLAAANFAPGLALFCIGLGKKILLADNIGFYADSVFNAAQMNWPLASLEAWLGSFCYTFQLYFDFSGYTDMALGIGLMIGLRLPENFNSPYRATGIVDFWHRWHITLSTWLRDFLYIPLGGNRHGRARQYINLFLTMLIGGAWHGAGWTYIIWGALHGLMLVVNHAWRLLIRGKSLEKAMLLLPVRFVCIAFTFFCLNFCWVVFRSPSLDAACAMYKAMFWQPVYERGVENGANIMAMGALNFPEFVKAWLPNHLFAGWQPFCLLSLCAVICWAMPNSHAIIHDDKSRDCWLRWRPSKVWAAYLAIVAFASITLIGRQSTFLYFQF